MTKYSRINKKLIARQKFLRVCVWLVMILIVTFVGGNLYRYVLKAKMQLLILEALKIDVIFLCQFLIYVFVILGFILTMTVYWVGWDNVRSRLRLNRYRSSLVVRDYYKRQRRLQYERVVGGLNRFSDNKLDLTGKEKEERLLFNLDSGTAVMTPVGTIAFKDGKLDGVFVSHFGNGKVESEVNYKDGKFDGHFRTYYPDGRLHAEKFYKDGKLEGVFKAYDEDGSIFFEINYKGGKQEGFDKTYYRSGVMQYLDIYQEDKRIHRKTYDEGGNLKYEEDFD